MTGLATRLDRLAKLIGPPPSEGRDWYVISVTGDGDRRQSPCDDPSHSSECYQSTRTRQHYLFDLPDSDLLPRPDGGPHREGDWRIYRGRAVNG